MIKISGNRLDTKNLLEKYSSNNIATKIINILDSSRTEYEYASLSELEFEIKFRINIIKASIDLYRTDFSFAVFDDARCNDKYWKLTPEGGFLLKDGVKASDAIKDIYENGYLYATECATAMVILYYKALLSIYPEELLNKTFPKIHLMNWHYINRELRHIGYVEKYPDYLPGDRRYFKNPDVNPETPEWQGENVIDLGNGTYYGHGIGIGDADEIINALNENRKPDSKTSAYFMDVAARPNFKLLARIYDNFIASQSRTQYRRFRSYYSSPSF